MNNRMNKFFMIMIFNIRYNRWINNSNIKRGPPSQSLGYRQTPVYEDSGPQIMNHRVPYI